MFVVTVNEGHIENRGILVVFQRLIDHSKAAFTMTLCLSPRVLLNVHSLPHEHFLHFPIHI
jgi:hypothetical protein